MEELRGVTILQNELEKSKGRLKGFNESIKKLTGSDHPGGARSRLGLVGQGSDFQITTGQRGRRTFSTDAQDNESFSGRMGRGRGRIFGLAMAKRGLTEDSGPPVKRRATGGAFSRLGPAPTQRRVREESPEEEELPKGLSVHSSVVSTSREAKNREEIMQEQTKDKEGMQRNRRMFGLLLGTLNRFKTDSKTTESKDEQRKKIDKKLEENAEKEKKKFKQETMELMEERHLEETRITKLEQKMDVVQEHADIEREMKKLKCFLCTKTKPRIFWKPKEMNSAAENKLKDSAKVVDEMLKTSQDRLEKEIKDVMDKEQKREERIKMRLREDGLFLDEENKEENYAKDKKSSSGKVGKGGDADNGDDVGDTKSQSNVKSKRRVVLEEKRDVDSGSDSESAEEMEDREIKEQDVAKKSTSKPRKDSEDEDDSGDSSGSDNEKDRNKHAQIPLPTDAADRGNKSSTGKNDKSEDEEEEEEVQKDHGSSNSRVVEYREKSADKERPNRQVSKADKSENSSRDRHRDENREKSAEKERPNRHVSKADKSESSSRDHHRGENREKSADKERPNRHVSKADKSDRHRDENRENSTDKERPNRHVSKADKSEGSSRDRHRDERRSQKEERHKRKEEKHSHRSEKRSRRDSDKAVIKEEREEKEKKKHKPERTVVEES